MTQADLNRALVGTIGEPIGLIDQHGFGFADVPVMERDRCSMTGDDENARAFGSTFE